MSILRGTGPNVSISYFYKRNYDLGTRLFHRGKLIAFILRHTGKTRTQFVHGLFGSDINDNYLRFKYVNKTGR